MMLDQSLDFLKPNGKIICSKTWSTDIIPFTAC